MVRAMSPRRLVAPLLLAALAALSALSSACSSTEATPAPTPPASAAGGDGDGGAPIALPDAGGLADASAKPSGSSGGSGGLACARTEDVGTGHAACVVTVGGVELKIVPPLGGTGPVRLGLYLHGDGAGAHKSGSALKAMTTWIEGRRGLGVSALAPNGCSWWQKPTHDCASAASEPDSAADNTRALVLALEAIEKAWDVRRDAVSYYGSSGGSIFLTSQWLPLQGGARPGVFALMCGGEVGAQKAAWDMTDAGARARSSLAFTYGDQDFLASDVRAAIAGWGKLGFDVAEKVIPGAAHCAFDAHAEAMAVWQSRP